jgi:glyoxylase-like metal-dependent hydrolase (beta-lactamase superfamily II)
MITKPHEIHPGVTVLYGGRSHGRHPYVNAVELRGSERILIDPGLCHEEYLSTRLDSYDLVLNTHGHPDHTSLNSQFTCPCGCHPAEKSYIEDPALLRDAQGFPKQDLCDEWDRVVGRLWESKPCTIQQTFEDGDVIDLGSLEFRVIHTPGHSVGHICLFEEQWGILIAGDYDLNPIAATFTNLLSNADDWLASFQRLIELGPRFLLTGHMPVVDNETVEQMIERRRHLLAYEEQIRLFLKEPRRFEEISEFARANFMTPLAKGRRIGRWFFDVALSSLVERLIRRGEVRLLGDRMVAV